MNNLSPLEQNTINEFVGIVGISLDSPEMEDNAISLLSYHNYNLNNSVLAFFETGLEVPVQEPLPEPSFDQDASFSSGFGRGGSEYLHQSLQNDFGLELFLPKLARAPKISNKWQFDLGIHMSKRAFEENEKQVPAEKKVEKRQPLWWLIVLIFPKTLSFLYSAFRYLLGLDLLNIPKNVVKDKFDYSSYDEHYAISERLEDSTSYEIAFEGFNSCYDIAELDYKFLLVLLVSDDSEDFMNKFLNQPLMKTLLNKSTGEFKETLLYVGNVDKSPEAFEVFSTYKSKRTPFIGLLGNVSRDPSIKFSMSTIYKANCALGDDEEVETLLRKLSKNLQKHLSDNNPLLVTKRFDKQEIEFSRLIKEKQDAAYIESLNSDKIKKLERENILREKDTQKKRQQVRELFILNLIKTNYFENRIKDVSLADLVRISIKLPNGNRIVQKFHKESLMYELYLFVETKLMDEKEGLNVEQQAESLSLDDFINMFTFQFELFKPFPKCPLPATAVTIANFGNLASGDNILFEYEDEREDSDS